MAKDGRPTPGIEPDLVVDRIYQIALEPSSLDDFINLWHETNLPEQFLASEDDGRTNPYETHLDRANAILQRGATLSPDLQAYLHPYQYLAAFVVDEALVVGAVNPGARCAYDVSVGDHLRGMRLPDQVKDALTRETQKVLHGTGRPEQLIKTELPQKAGSLVFRIVQLDVSPANGRFALISSNHFSWREEVGDLLAQLFLLTNAEQNVVRMLLEGHETKSIAAVRSTSEGTVRGQIKSIIGKMNVRSQTDIVRMVMMLGAVPGPGEKVGETAPNVAKAHSNNWFEREVWKPFKSVKRPDGRTVTYHDMGPPNGAPILISHMGSCMVRWSAAMLATAFEQDLRVICPIRAGYGPSDPLDANADPIESASSDYAYLIEELGLRALPFVAQGTDFAFAAHFSAHHPKLVSEVFGVGARPCLPGGASVDGAGRWQRFFVSTARQAPHLVQFASKAVMAMCTQIGPEAMLRQLCKDSASDLALLENEEMLSVLAANISLMASKSTNAGRAFAMEYVAFQADWSNWVREMRQIPVRVYLADEDPTMDLGALPLLKEAYPWIAFDVMEGAGLALLFQMHDVLIPEFAKAAKRAQAINQLGNS